VRGCGRTDDLARRLRTFILYRCGSTFEEVGRADGGLGISEREESHGGGEGQERAGHCCWDRRGRRNCTHYQGLATSASARLEMLTKFEVLTRVSEKRGRKRQDADVSPFMGTKR